jgi:hypothetical protein
MYRQLEEIHAIPTTQPAECAHWRCSNLASRATRRGALYDKDDSTATD